MFEARAPNAAVVAGYVVMRLAMVAQWLRAAASDPQHRATARRYAVGISAAAGGLDRPAVRARRPACRGFSSWSRSSSPCPSGPSASAPTTWHPHHIAERYGLLTLIVLGESILAATGAVQSALASGEAARRRWCRSSSAAC